MKLCRKRVPPKPSLWRWIGALSFLLTATINTVSAGEICLEAWARLGSKTGMPFAAENKNAQLMAWAIADAGHREEARAMEAEISRHMSSMAFRLDGRPTEGMTGAVFVVFENGMRAVMKPTNSSRGLIAENERAVFRLQRLLGGTARVPVTVVRREAGVNYSFQVFVPSSGDRSLQLFTQEMRDMRFLDLLIDNTDRATSNFLVSNSGHMAAIDHGKAFRNDYRSRRSPFRQNPWSMVLTRSCGGSPPIRSLDKACVRNYVKSVMSPEMYRALRDTPEAEFRQALEGLTPGNIEAFLWRRQLVLDIENGREIQLTPPAPGIFRRN